MLGKIFSIYTSNLSDRILAEGPMSRGIQFHIKIRTQGSLAESIHARPA